MTALGWTPERWQAEVREGLVSLRELDPNSSIRLVYGADEVGRLSFGLITRRPPGLPQLSEAVTIVRAEREHDGTWILLLTLNDSKFSDVFVQLCGHVQAKVSKSKTEAAGISTAMECFMEWRQLFQSSKKHILSMQERRGLFAELDFAFNVLGRRVGPAAVVEGWQGPYGSDQDFQFVDAHYEIKSRYSTTHALQIASEHQLEGDNITLVCVEVASSSNELPGFKTLPEYASWARDSLTQDGGDLEVFDSALEQIGFNPNDETYSEDYFQAQSYTYFDVSGNFPRITSRDIAIGLSSVKYRIDLTSIDEFIIDEETALSLMKSYGSI